MSDHEQHEHADRDGEERNPSILDTLSEAVLGTAGGPETDADVPDDASGVEVPQDGDPGR